MFSHEDIYARAFNLVCTFWFFQRKKEITRFFLDFLKSFFFSHFVPSHVFSKRLVRRYGGAFWSCFCFLILGEEKETERKEINSRFVPFDGVCAEGCKEEEQESSEKRRPGLVFPWQASIDQMETSLGMAALVGPHWSSGRSGDSGMAKLECTVCCMVAYTAFQLCAGLLYPEMSSSIALRPWVPQVGGEESTPLSQPVSEVFLLLENSLPCWKTRVLVQRESIEVFMSNGYATRYADHQLISAALLFLRVLLLVFIGFQMDNLVQRQQQTEGNRINLSWPRMCHYKQALPVCRMSLEKDLEVNAKTCSIAQFNGILSSFFSSPPPPPLCMHSSM